ncbi:hypothetical protein BCR41DRAFT_105663 [Lobosporangium transversale]|uniref:Eukaryotic translation initiation factor 3 subunit C N-terminal domain-containing protein n=1 Tax=Lobosporangium transversale TaxID=64571 RepID=A0A1Y2GIX5_9FUNG|nr:hypothetical protein BCR41DRAFT_105663 [Lobosporangium transversale]ORZ12152.1 hypothetical protein BCR41DRAFT_105663 [Lobosporangium transversale]|eukprot:XP_021880017.1 hypothetical protein BCR41DRAFT_105663 [Lobosporangium transversale]
MSRFFRAGESDSDDTESDYSEELTASESEDHSDSDSDESSSDDERPGKKPQGRLFGLGSDDSDSDDDEVRVVRSAKDKRFEEIEQAVTSMANGQKINDWVSVQNAAVPVPLIVTVAIYIWDGSKLPLKDINKGHRAFSPPVVLTIHVACMTSRKDRLAAKLA